MNNGRDWNKLFATGDTVDFQFACDPKADPKRRDPVPGDKLRADLGVTFGDANGTDTNLR